MSETAYHLHSFLEYFEHLTYPFLGFISTRFSRLPCRPRPSFKNLYGIAAELIAAARVTKEGGRPKEAGHRGGEGRREGIPAEIDGKGANNGPEGDEEEEGEEMREKWVRGEALRSGREGEVVWDFKT
ncbi:hypothetical protein QJS10_CPA16g00017 [Acorus calamus]|uniref:Uncharacterized protein n=1 Tax=Acorus calamus TaxID=4465 RepID=A0AAV9CZU3_ACOCL|nr:hypothetical protein QJS10_CPA16g00017 [Acorus calamus]